MKNIINTLNMVIRKKKEQMFIHMEKHIMLRKIMDIIQIQENIKYQIIKRQE